MFIVDYHYACGLHTHNTPTHNMLVTGIWNDLLLASTWIYQLPSLPPEHHAYPLMHVYIHRFNYVEKITVLRFDILK